MFTSQDTVDSVVQKTVAFQHAVGSHIFAGVRPALERNRADTLPPPSPFHRGSSQEEMLKSRGRPQTPTIIPEPTAAAAAAATGASFTFRVPLNSTTARRSPQQHEQRHVARSALSDALRRHEDALRAWADEPYCQLSSRGARTALPPPASSKVTDSQLLPSQVWHSADVDKSTRGGCTHEGSTSAAAAAAASPSRVAKSLGQPFTRVLAKDSMAGIGLPRHRTTNGVSPTPAASPAAGTVESDVEVHLSDDGYAASQSSLSSTDSETHHCVVVRVGEATDFLSTSTASRAAALTPYQLPLRMRQHAPNSASPAAADTPDGQDELEKFRHSLLQAQAQRYAQWRRRQTAVLHRLAPDMWDRALPPYAALDGTPQVMDGGMLNGASTVRRSRYDSGVVYV